MNHHTLPHVVACCAVVLIALGLCACNKSAKVGGEVAQVSVMQRTDSVSYIDVTHEAGITWKHVDGEDGNVYFPEPHCGGCCFIDYDNDGWLDVLITDGRHWPGHRPAQESTMVLYHNNHDGTFTDVTKQAGLAIPMFGNGVNVGDYDNDGWDDIYLTGFQGNHLFHNDHGVFRDVTKKARVPGYGRWSSSSMWIDYDNDGYLDLFVGGYINWTPETDVYCTIDGRIKSICTPAIYPSDFCQLYHNNHNGTFTDVSKQAGITDVRGNALGLAMMDYDEDGWTDVIITCDQTPNRLLHNEHGKFRDVGIEAGIAYDEAGIARAGMGIDWADVERDGKPTVMIGNFSGEMDWVYKYMGNSVFVDRAPTDGVGTASQPWLTFGLVMFDFDYDGWPDMFSVNGHVKPEIEHVVHSTMYRQPSLLFRNQGNGHFEEVGDQYLKGPFDKHIVGRGTSYGDFNNDGNIDLLIASLNDYPMLWKCERKNSNHYLRIKLQGVKSNRNGFGARFYATVGKMKMMDMMKSGSSYQSSNESVVTLGLGQAKQVDELIIKWNCGTTDTLRNIAGDRMVVVKEGSGVAENYQWKK